MFIINYFKKKFHPSIKKAPLFYNLFIYLEIVKN